MSSCIALRHDAIMVMISNERHVAKAIDLAQKDLDVAANCNFQNPLRLGL